jgi:hypothetical protein
LSTGGGFSTRQNYSDDEEKLFDAMRPVLLNGISVGLERADVLDRSLVTVLNEMSDESRRTEADFWPEVRSASPRIFGALLDAVSCSLRRLPEVKIPQLPRMADFACWATAAEPSFGCASGAFLSAYRANRQDANDLALESSSLFSPVKAIAEEGWSGTASELLSFLESEPGVNRRQQDWPKNPAKLAGQLRRLTPSLLSVGIIVQMEQTAGANSRKIISITRRP